MMAKVCGLTSASDVAMVLEEGPDFLGFLHHPPSGRHCPDLALAREAGRRAVLVAVAPRGEDLLPLVRQGGFAWVQPHVPRPERPRTVLLLREAGCSVLLPWPDEPDQEALAPDLFLWEASPLLTGVAGGSGQGHGMAHPPPGPFLLAGGLDGGNLGGRLSAMPPAARSLCRGFDAASRLESSPGRKDPARVHAFIQGARALECP